MCFQTYAFVSRIQFSVTVILKNSVSWWLVAQSCPQLLAVSCSFLPWGRPHGCWFPQSHKGVKESYKLNAIILCHVITWPYTSYASYHLGCMLLVKANHSLCLQPRGGDDMRVWIPEGKDSRDHIVSVCHNEQVGFIPIIQSHFNIQQLIDVIPILTNCKRKTTGSSP